MENIIKSSNNKNDAASAIQTALQSALQYSSPIKTYNNLIGYFTYFYDIASFELEHLLFITKRLA